MRAECGPGISRKSKGVKDMATRQAATKPMQDEWRARIKQGVLLNRLAQHAEGLIEMTPTQVQACRILLGKCLPDLSSVEMSGPAGGSLSITINKL